MFQRLLWHLLRSNRVRVIVALLALTSGGAVVSALLNLNLDINRKLSQEFRSLGANLIVTAQSAAAASGSSSALINEKVMETLGSERSNRILASPYLYTVAHVASSGNRDVVVAGTWLDRITGMDPSWQISGNASIPQPDLVDCLVGVNVSRTLKIAKGSKLALTSRKETVSLAVSGIVDAGGSADNQIFVNLPVAQKLARTEGQIQMVELSVPGTPKEIRAVQARLQSELADLAVRPIPQIAVAEDQLLGRIRFLIISTGVLILVLTSLCILATTAAVAMERRKDVGLMKALGGSMRRVLRIFLAEVGILGVTGGILGYIAGMFLSVWMGHRVFGASITPRWEVLPATIALMLVVSLAGALPLRFLGNVRPAVILRGE